jgi:hypothetical protein
MPADTPSNSINLFTREGGICARLALNDDQYAALCEAVSMTAIPLPI